MAKTYLPRIADQELEFKLQTFGAVNITGPKWCGKSRTAEEHSKSSIFIQSFSDKGALKAVINSSPGQITDGDRPRLIDEWQDIPAVWDRVRFECDRSGEPGQFILTGSTSKKANTSHTGTGRISELRMYPMSLFESGESNGTVSLKALFDGSDLEAGGRSDLSLPELAFAICRGGWPYSLGLKSKESMLAVSRDYYAQLLSHDMFSVDGVKRDPVRMAEILRAYARNISTLAKRTTLRSSMASQMSDVTFEDYVSVLRMLYIVEDLDGWCPNLRSSSAERSGPKREFVDPSIAAAATGATPDMLTKDLKTFGFLFECLCVRDLRVYSERLGGRMSYYHDRYDLEADGVLHLVDGRYALIEFKLGSSEIDKGAEHLNKIEELVRTRNKDESQMPLDLPSVKIIVTATGYAYRREDGVFVVPIGCLGP